MTRKIPWDDVWMYDYEDAGPAVCMTHKRFIPCRKNGSHTYSDIPEDVEVVRAYQQGVIREANEKRNS